MGFMAGASGFAKGFGDAFANTYSAGLERNARKEAQAEERKYDSEKMTKGFEHDTFMLKLKQSAEDAKDLREQKKKESGYSSQAEAIARANGGDAKDYYSKLASGMTYSDVDSYAGSIDWKAPGAVSTPTPAAGTVAQQTVSAMPGLDEEYAGATSTQMQQMNDILPQAPAPTQTPESTATTVKPDITTESGYIGTRKVKATPMMSLTDRLQTAIANNPDSEETRALAAKVRMYNEVIREAEPEKADLDQDYQAALKTGDADKIAQAEDRLKRYKETVEKNNPEKANAMARFEAAVATGDKEAIAKAADDVRLVKSVTDPEKPKPADAAREVQEALALPDSDPTKAEKLMRAATNFKTYQGITAVPKDPQKADLQADYDAALKSGNRGEIARTKALLDESEATKNANRPKPVGRTTVDLQNELTLATTPDERARIQAAIDASTGSEYSAKVLSEGPKQGIWVDENGNFKPGAVKPERGPNGQIRWVGRDGTAGARPFIPGEDDALKGYFKAGTSGEAKDQREKVSDVAAAYRSAARVNDILSENPDILAGGTGAVTKFISDMVGEMRAAGKLLNVEVKSNADGSIDPSSIAELEKRLEGVNIKDIEDDAAKRAIFNAEMGTMVFRAGAALGQTGAAFGSKDQALVRQIVGADASKGETAQTIIGNYLENARRRVDDGSNLINQQAATEFEGQWGWVPPQKVVPTVDELIESNPNDPLLKRGRTLGSTDTNTNPQSAQKTSSGVTWRIK